MKNRVLKWASVLSAVSLVCGVLIVTANAHIGSSHSPLSTEGPDLRTATVEDDEVQFCFDQEVAEVDTAAPADFTLAGYDSDESTDGTDVELTENIEECVDVEFADTDKDVSDYTVALVDAGTVENRANDDNPDATVGLTGTGVNAEAGATDAPNLTGFEEDADDNTINFQFDQDVDCTTGANGLGTPLENASDFGYYDDGGEGGGRNNGATVAECDDNEVTVNFGNVDDVERVFIDPDGAGDSPCEVAGDTGDIDCTGFESFGGRTDDPDLTDVERTDDSEWTFILDEDVTAVVTAEAYIYMSDGNEIRGTNCNEEDNNAIQCDFEEAGVDLEDQGTEAEVVLASVNNCAAQADDDNGPGDCNTVGSVAVGQADDAGAGFTDAPDLESCTVDAAEEQATFNFDENQDDDDDPTAADFDLVDSSGNLSSGSEIDDNEGTTVVVDYNNLTQDDINDLAGCHVDAGAIQDDASNDSVEASVGSPGGSGIATTATVTTGGTDTTSTTTTATTTTTQSPTPTTRREATNVTIEPKFKGSVGSGNRNCQQGRRVRLKKVRPGRDKVVGKDTSNNQGNWKIRKRAKRGRFYATALPKRFTAGNGDTVICLRDSSTRLRIRPRRR